ncbi:MAG: hypothetical protein DELT_02986 [Desulfovibrio sp.]
MSLATLTKTGRAAIAKAISTRPLFLAWGTGDPAWDEEGAELPSLVEATLLFNEVGRRIPTTVGFVTPDDDGDIIIPKGRGTNDTVQEARYRRSDEPTPYLYVQTSYEFADASNSVIRELGVFMDGVAVAGLPAGQRYYLPSEVAEPGLLLAAQILQPGINRSPSVRQVIDFVLPL